MKVYTVWIKAVKCRPMINKPPPFKGLDIRIPIIIPIKGREFINEGSALVLRAVSSTSALRHPQQGSGVVCLLSRAPWDFLMAEGINLCGMVSNPSRLPKAKHIKEDLLTRGCNCLLFVRGSRNSL